MLTSIQTQAECNFPYKGGNDGCLDEKGVAKEQPLIKVIENIRILVEFSNATANPYSNKAKDYLEPEHAIEILKRIDPNDYYALGCTPTTKPHWMIITVLPIPPPIMRPSNMSNAAARGEDDLTYKLSDIIRTRNNLIGKMQSKASASDIQACRQMLQLYVTSYFDNQAVGHTHIMQRMGRPQKGKINCLISCTHRFIVHVVYSCLGIKQRLRGKDGRIRGSLMGKRCDHTARTVISPDPNISVRDVGVPRSVARIVTYPEMVNNLNLEKLTQCVKNGPNGIDGANFVKLLNGSKLDLRTAKAKDIKLEPGMVVRRHMMDGDVVLMNRQPSLHKFSIQAHR